MKKINRFGFKCNGCENKYTDESFSPTCESECPECGEWNYSAETSGFKVGQQVAKQIVIMGLSTISLGYTVCSIKNNVKIRDNHDKEISVHEYDQNGRERTHYSPCGTSYLKNMNEFIQIIKNGSAEFDGNYEELLDILLRDILNRKNKNV